MTKTIALCSGLIFLMATGPAFGDLVNVDFSAMGNNVVDITKANNPAGVTLNGVTFTYDDFGSGVDFASVDRTGIFGSTAGLLSFNLDAPATALNFDFALLGATGDIPDGLVINFQLLQNGQNVADLEVPATLSLYDPSNPSLGGDALGSLAYSGAAFDQAQMFFSVDVPYFTVSNISIQPVPEPTVTVLVGLGLGSVAWLRRRRSLS